MFCPHRRFGAGFFIERKTQMLFEEKKIKLKDGRTAVFRSPRPEDAQALLDYMKVTSGETPYLLRTPEECTMTLQQEQGFIAAAVAQEYDVMILCFVDDALAGNCRIVRHNKIKNRHRADVMIALYEKYWGLGIGTAMFHEMISLAEKWGLMQLELEVIEGNNRAIGLYEKMGFKTVAETPNAIYLPDGALLKEFLMIRPI